MDEIVYIGKYDDEYFPYAMFDSVDTIGTFVTLAEAVQACAELKARGEIVDYVIEAE